MAVDDVLFIFPQISINGRHFADYNHRAAFQQISVIGFFGEFQIQSLSFQQDSTVVCTSYHMNGIDVIFFSLEGWSNVSNTLTTLIQLKGIFSISITSFPLPQKMLCFVPDLPEDDIPRVMV